MGRFLKNLFNHPGTWVLGTLIFAFAGIGAAPATATVLIVFAGFSILAAAVTFLPYLIKGIENLMGGGAYDLDKQLSSVAWVDAHPWQALAVGLAIAGLITTLTLTIGFFSGGTGFIFMAPVFSAIASPFAAFSAAYGVSLFTPAIAGFLFVIAPLAVGNNLKRFLGWVDSFKHDFTQNYLERERKDDCRPDEYRDMAERTILQYGYPKVLECGINATYRRGSSPFLDAKDRKEEEEAAKARMVNH